MEYHVFAEFENIKIGAGSNLDYEHFCGDEIVFCSTKKDEVISYVEKNRFSFDWGVSSNSNIGIFEHCQLVVLPFDVEKEEYNYDESEYFSSSPEGALECVEEAKRSYHEFLDFESDFYFTIIDLLKERGIID